MDFEILKTERLHLRKLTPEVFNYIYGHFTDDAIKNLLGLENDEQLQKEKDKYNIGLSTYNKSFVYFQLIDVFTSKIIGGCGFHTWYVEHSRAEIGYSLANDLYKQKGIMTEALQPIIQYGFTQMKLNRIEAFVGLNNKPSLRLMKKFGFVQEGHLKQHYCKTDTIEDSLLFALLAADYAKIKAE